MTDSPKYQRVPQKEEDTIEDDDDDLTREETYEDSDSEDESDTDNDDDDSNSSTGSSSWKDVIVWSAWRQHAVAILVAVLATIGATVWQHHYAQQDSSVNYYYNTAALSPVYASTFRHEHLDQYHRTANISFCGSLTSHVEDRLEMMDFHVPLESIDAMYLHYYADALEDDDYSQVLGRNHVPFAKLRKNDEFHCLRQLHKSTTSKNYVQGMTYFYRAPSYVDMFPHVMEEAMQKKQPEDEDTTRNNAVSKTGKPKINKRKMPKPASLSFTGFGAKFINLSPNPVLLHWDGKGGHKDAARLVGEIPPFDSLGTATTPGQSFSVSPVYDTSHALERWVATADDAVLVYEDVSKRHKWTVAEEQQYQLQKINLEFAKHYLMASHRHWLAHFPRRFPVHPLHPADYVGQVHTLMSLDDDNEDKTLQLQVVSVTPRVFSIDNFLTDDECHSLMAAAQAQGLQGSTLYAGGMAPQAQRDRSTRSSTNTWLGRDTSVVTDRIYRRAAHLLQMKSALLQQPAFYRDDDDPDAPHHDVTQHAIAESLQIIRYQPGEEYTAHHDFVYPSQRHRYQPTRYATLLLYLNDDFTGGETNFPRAINPTHHEGLTVTPKKGQAVLFYNILPDGNVDDFSQHQSLPVQKGEKWLANLWVWDPVIN
jgi:prolyl 4-hydroxylase